MASGWSTFLSYRTRLAPEVAPLVAALDSARVHIWRDEERVDEGASIGEGVRRGIAGSRAMLCWASLDYPQSRVCQWELAVAWVAAEMDGAVDNRVLVLLPPGVKDPGHLPEAVRDRKVWRVPSDEAELRAFAAGLAGHLTSLGPRTLGDLAPLERRPPWLLRKEAVPSRRFVGRADALWKLHCLVQADKLTVVTGQSGVGPAQVRGLGGNGKTLLAMEYIARFGGAFPGGVLWVDVASRTPEDVLGEVATALGVRPDRPEEVRVALMSRGRYLWVADNVPAGLSRRDAEGWCAPTPNGRTLLTTRSRAWAGMGGELDLGVLEPDEALALLCRDRPPEGPTEQQAAALLCNDVGFHPLTIDVLRALLRDSSAPAPFVHWRGRLREPGKDALRLGEHLAEDLPTGTAKYVGIVLDASFTALSPEALELLLLATSMAHGPIPSKLAEQVFASAGEHATEDRVFRGLQNGRSQGLVDPGDGLTYTVHALVRRLIALVPRHGARVADLRAAAIQALPAWFEGVNDMRNHHRMAPVVAHAEHLAGHGTTVDEAALAHLTAQLRHVRGEYPAARRGWARAFEARTRLLGPEHPDTLITMRNVADTLSAQGDLSGARGLYERALEAMARLLGPEHPDTLSALQNLAGILYAQGDLAGARRLGERSLEAMTGLLGPEHPHTLLTMQNLASVLSAQGDLAGGRGLYERALEAIVRQLGPEHPDTITTLQNFAASVRAQGDLAGARALFERALEARTLQLGPEHPDTLSTLQNLAGILYAQGDLAAALRLYKRALEARTRLLGSEHPDTLMTLQNLAVILYAEGDLAGARRLQERALEAETRLLGSEHPDTLMTLQNLAVTLKAARSTSTMAASIPSSGRISSRTTG